VKRPISIRIWGWRHRQINHRCREQIISISLTFFPLYNNTVTTVDSFDRSKSKKKKGGKIKNIFSFLVSCICWKRGWTTNNPPPSQQRWHLSSLYWQTAWFGISRLWRVVLQSHPYTNTRLFLHLVRSFYIQYTTRDQPPPSLSHLCTALHAWLFAHRQANKAGPSRVTLHVFIFLWLVSITPSAIKCMN
jgi:hypothetical protein